MLSTVINERTLGWYSTKVYTERLRPKVQPLTLLYTIFDKKGTPFVYLLLTNCIPSTYLVSLEICNPFNCSPLVYFYEKRYPFRVDPPHIGKSSKKTNVFEDALKREVYLYHDGQTTNEG